MSDYSVLANSIMNGPCGFCHAHVMQGEKHKEGCPCIKKVKMEIEHVDKDFVILKTGEKLRIEDYPMEPLFTITPVASEFLSVAYYRKGSSELELNLVNGNKLTYIEVPLFVALTLAMSKSMGRIYNTMIKGKYALKGL